MQEQNRDFPIAVIHEFTTFAMSFGHGDKRVVPLSREMNGKSADVEAFTQLAAAGLM